MTTKTKKRTRRSEAADDTDRVPARRKKQNPIEHRPDNGVTGDRLGGELDCVTDNSAAAQDTMIDDRESGIDRVAVDQRQSSDEGLLGTEIMGVAAICREIQGLQRQRRAAMKLRIMLENGTTAFVASMIGYSANMDDKKRKKVFSDAQKMVKRIDEDDHTADNETSDEGEHRSDIDRAVAPLVRITFSSRSKFADYEKRLLAKMTKLAGQLPVAAWFDHPDRRGIKLTMLATIVGEAGNLSDYPNPAKLWKRLFGAPYEKEGHVRMPSSWRRKGGLAADEWSDIGYSPRRNASTYQLRENIVMQNREGPYRKRYDEAKSKSKANPSHEDWTDAHHHSHAQLLAAKRFVLDLWKEWNSAGNVLKPRSQVP